MPGTADTSELIQSLNVRIVGDAEAQRTLVLAHGFGCTQSLWEKVLPALLKHPFQYDGGAGAGLRIILFDWPGACSTSLSTPPPLFFNAFSQILLSLLHHLHVTSCIFVGHSMSAMIGCIAALQKPALFDKLILVAASPRYLNDGDYYGGFEQEDLDNLYDALAADLKGWAARFAGMVVGVEGAEEAIERFSATLSNMQTEVALGMAKAIFQSDFRGVVEELSTLDHMKVVVLQTRQDRAVPLVVSDYFKLSFGNKATVEVLQTDGHFPQLTAPHLFTSALIKHLM